jgi:hypothetical protein
LLSQVAAARVEQIQLILRRGAAVRVGYYLEQLPLLLQQVKLIRLRLALAVLGKRVLIPQVEVVVHLPFLGQI